ncbi:hypothetical protein Natpe_0967 [Natrinema pellirubrum DSM 15624]|uniref:Uncharacterized protein n=1 Tax=Natrinema pellirubrum (strain DSM 15624 / CIP 106293 / JCM 10476 / NCIMB 786 / 157) TaxID=797303 RepID=L0JH87_NATP1|nr:hypothetical protein Natpe_0967 [Natrinema pellirubrum DSM 15624]
MRSEASRVGFESTMRLRRRESRLYRTTETIHTLIATLSCGQVCSDFQWLYSRFGLERATQLADSRRVGRVRSDPLTETWLSVGSGRLRSDQARLELRH